MACGEKRGMKGRTRGILALTLPGNPTEVRQALTAVRRALIASGIGNDGLVNTEIVLAEVLNNIVEHACSDGAAEICLEIALVSGGLEITVIDGGGEMPGGQLPLAGVLVRPDSLDGLPEGGFGWLLIRQMAKDLVYRHRNGRNSLSFLVDLGDTDLAAGG